jgi:integrase
MATGKRATARLHLLTAREVQAAGEGDHGDGGGLSLRVQGTAASWVLRYTDPTGKRREMGLGVAFRGSTKQAGDSLTTARDLAHKAREQLRNDVDPLAAREQQREAERMAAEARKAERARDHWTLARCARDYHERVIEPTRTTKHGAQWLSSLENHIPPDLWHAPAGSIEAPALLLALQSVKPHERARNLKGDRVPETLRRIRQRLDSVFEDAIFNGRCSRNPAAAIRRKMRESEPRRERGQLAALPYGEAPAFVQRLRAAEGTAARCLELAILCTARTTEALHAEWIEVDLQAGTWVVRAARMKAKEPHTVYLPPRAVEILKAQAGQHARWVFPSPMNADKPMSNMAMLAVLDRMGARAATTVHGLCRATFSTWANETGAGRPDVIEACLAHEESNRVRASYNRATFNEERRALLLAWAEYLAQPAAQVLQFGARAA